MHRERQGDVFHGAQRRYELKVLEDEADDGATQQRALLAGAGLSAEYATVKDWIGSSESLTGVLISNEFFDTLPVHIVERRDETLHEWYVRSREGSDEAGGFAFQLGPRHQGGHGIDHQHVEGGRAHQGIGEL